MADAVFDGPNLHINLPAPGSYQAQRNLYSAWKEWVRQSDNAKFPKAFDTTGGDFVGDGQSVAPYFFCRNDLGWRIKMPAADGDVVLNGNLFARNTSITLFEQTSGYDAFLRLQVSTNAIVVEVGASGLSVEQAAQLALIESATAGKAVLSSDGLTITLYAADNVTPLRVLDVSSDLKTRTPQ